MLKNKIIEILEKHYHGRNQTEERCAEEILKLFESKQSTLIESQLESFLDLIVDKKDLHSMNKEEQKVLIRYYAKEINKINKNY